MALNNINQTKPNSEYKISMRTPMITKCAEKRRNFDNKHHCVKINTFIYNAAINPYNEIIDLAITDERSPVSIYPYNSLPNEQSPVSFYLH